MKKSMLGLVAIGALIVGPAMAADLRMPVKAPPAPIVPVYSWTGWYIGLNAGGIWSASRDTVEPTGCFLVPTVLCGGPLTNNALRTDTGNLNGSGFTGGGQIGYNWQNNAFVYGLEADLNFSSLNATYTVSRALAAPLVGVLNHTVNEKLDWFGTLRGRLGVTPVPQALLYVTGGLAYGHVTSNSNINFTAGTDTYVGALDVTRAGWTVGGGGEWAFSPNLSAKIEYLYVDLGRVNYADSCVSPAVICGGFTPAPSYQTDLTIRDHIVRFGLNYRFGGGAIATRY